MIKRTINQEDVTILNKWTPNSGTPHFIRSILVDFKAQIDPNPVISGFNIHLFQQTGHLGIDILAADNSFSKTDDILGQKTNLNKHRKM